MLCKKGKCVHLLRFIEEVCGHLQPTLLWNRVVQINSDKFAWFAPPFMIIKSPPQKVWSPESFNTTWPGTVSQSIFVQMKWQTLWFCFLPSQQNTFVICLTPELDQWLSVITCIIITVVEDLGTWVCIATTDWTGGSTLMMYTRRGWADSISWGGWDPSTCAARCWRSSTGRLLPVHCCLLQCAGGAASEPETPTDWTNWSQRLALQTGHLWGSDGEEDTEQTVIHYG